MDDSIEIWDREFYNAWQRIPEMTEAEINAFLRRRAEQPDGGTQV